MDVSPKKNRVCVCDFCVSRRLSLFQAASLQLIRFVAAMMMQEKNAFEIIYTLGERTTVCVRVRVPTNNIRLERK